MRTRPHSRAAVLDAARRAADAALARCLADLRDAVRADRAVVVFRLQRAGDALGLSDVEVLTGEGSRSLAPVGEHRAEWTALYGDLLESIGRWAGVECPEGLVIGLAAGPAGPRADLVGYPGEHCDHWDGGPELTLEYPAPDPLAGWHEAPFPDCCPGHRVSASLEAGGAAVPSVRGDFDCDDPPD